MKSVIQEASSLNKAIEQGWIKAGKPKEFSIRILQESNKNFLGITIKNAKVAVFFGRIDKMPLQQPQPHQEHTNKRPQQQKTIQQRPQYDPNKKPGYRRPPQKTQQQQKPPPQQKPNK